MSLSIDIGGKAKNLTATGDISAGPCKLSGFYVNSTNAGTLVISDGTTALSGTITPAIGFHWFPADCGVKAVATIGGTALNVTFFFSAGN